MTEARMWLTIEGAKYDLQEAVQKAALKDLLELKRATRVDGSSGQSVRTITEALEKIGVTLSTLSEDDDTAEAALALFEDESILEAFIAIVFLAKRKSGEPVTFDEASGVSLADIGMSIDVEEEQEADDPKDQSTSDEQDDAAAD